ncbi:hypothetical protein ACFP65_05185 [Marinilactibacillus sp. GCM10026970]|uniref:hypothetical protein n=1 Tax=Marinilactibacillus sp. GCM10026970 TaxID=3252642 RepID=UPI00361A16AB
MVSGYKLLFWGLILAHVNITVGFFTVFPAFVGYLIFLCGYYDIEAETKKRRYLIPRICTALLVLLTIILPFMEHFLNLDVYSTLIYQYYQSILMLLEFTTVHYVFVMGINGLERRQLDEVAEKFVRKDKVFLWLMGLGICGVTIGVTANTNYFQIVGLVGNMLAFIAGVMILFTLSDFRTTFLENET